MRASRTRAVVLVVDDDPVLRQALQLVLEDEYDVVEAADAGEALAIARSGSIDLVLLDILMPETDGLQILSQLQAVRPGLPVVMVSGLDKASTAAAALRLGAVDYVTKPFEDRMLLDVLRAARQRNGTVQPRGGGRPLALLLGCGASTTAGIAASLDNQMDIESYPDLPPDPVLLRVRKPAILVLETGREQTAWLPRTALVLEHFSPVPAVVLLDRGGSMESRFAFGEGHLVLEPPLRLTTILEAMCHLLPEASSRRPWRHDRVGAVLDAMFNDGAAFDLGSVAHTLGLAPRHLCRSFMAHAGVSVAAYVNAVRVHATAFLLRHTDQKLDSIAVAVGFHDASHLSRAFIRFTGRRPGDFRARFTLG